MLIRRERPDDVERIDHVHRLAFADVAPAGSEPVEVGLLHALRADSGWVPALSLVAESRDGEVIGSILPRPDQGRPRSCANTAWTTRPSPGVLGHTAA
jgi:predicted N-acetyltransferase YhbS